MKFKQVWLPPIIDWAVAGNKVAFVVRGKHKSTELMYINDRNEFVLYNELITPRLVHHHLSKKGALVTTDAFGATIVVLPDDVIRTTSRGLGKPNDVDVLGRKYAVAFENGIVENVFGKDIHTMVPGPRKIALLDNDIVFAADRQLIIAHATGNQKYELPIHTAKGDFVRTPSNEVLLPLLRFDEKGQIEVGVVRTNGQFTVINRVPIPDGQDVTPRLLDVRYTASGITFAIDCLTTIVIVNEHGYNTLPLEGTVFDLKLTDDGVAIVGTSDTLQTGSAIPKRKANI
jgi:hypothetical protein